MAEEVGGVPTICLLGATGTGKSSTGNSLFAKAEVFDISDGPGSMTCEPAIKALPWRGDGELVRCVDLPGMADTQGRDLEHIIAMADVLKTQVRYVHAFLVIINSQVPRFDINLQEMLKKFRDVFGEEFLRNAMIGFTRWEFKRSAARQREKKGQTEAQKAERFNRELRDLLGHAFDCPCVFLNNLLNTMSEEDLEDEYGSEDADVRRAFEAELQKVHSFVCSREPFLCRNIEAVLAERETMKQWVRTMLPRADSLDADVLGRHLISPDNDFIRGWLRWRRPPGPPRSIWAVLRRQQLQFFGDESEAEIAGPQEVELLDCICGKAGWHLLSGRCFLIYKPVQNAVNLASSFELQQRGAEKYEFGVDSEADQRKWMYLVQEATRISESWSRILMFYRSLHTAQSLDEYVQAIRKVGNATMVIPMEWVRQCKRKREGGDMDLPEADFKRKLDQAQKDLTRDSICLDGRMLRCPTVDELASDVMLRILKTACADETAQDQALLLARDVVLNCSRTSGNGDIFDAVQELFKQADLVHTVVDQGSSEPVCVRIRRSDGSERVLQQEFLRSLDCSTGLPQFENDESAAALGIEKVRNLQTEGEQNLRIKHAGQDSWVPDWEMLQCMKCGIQFGTWVRRHHCRHCGALICSGCSQHSVQLVETEGASASASNHKMGRVCFTCYQKAVVNDLNARRSTGSLYSTASSSGEAEAENSEIADGELEREHNEAGFGRLSSGIAEETSVWPVINVEMTASYRLCSVEDLKDLFIVHCRHICQVRWSGVSDEGRVVISIEERQ